jgi:hypothetical protein
MDKSNKSLSNRTKPKHFGSLLAPESIAIIGTSTDLCSSSNFVLQNLLRVGYVGQFHLVSRSSKSKGLPGVSNVKDPPSGTSFKRRTWSSSC